MIENYRPDPEHNPTKLLPRGVKVWYADPCCSSQKPHIERFHSYPRESLGGKVPYDLFVAQHGDSGKAFLDKLGIKRIPAAQVTLHPFLLGQKYQRAAERAILKKHGVIGRRKTEEKK